MVVAKLLMTQKRRFGNWSELTEFPWRLSSGLLAILEGVSSDGGLLPVANKFLMTEHREGLCCWMCGGDLHLELTTMSLVLRSCGGCSSPLAEEEPSIMEDALGRSVCFS